MLEIKSGTVYKLDPNSCGDMKGEQESIYFLTREPWEEILDYSGRLSVKNQEEFLVLDRIFRGEECAALIMVLNTKEPVVGWCRFTMTDGFAPPAWRLMK